MEKELKNQMEAVQASSGGLLAVEQFLQNHYLFRRNVLSGKIEFATLPAEDESEYRELTPEAEMSIIIRARKVNGRPIFGRAQADRPRYASFVATTNNLHPLTDVTGSRRYICLTIPDGQLIDNTGDIDYQQLYAQVLYELRELKVPYWFNNDEVTRIQELNLDYMAKKDLTEMIEACFLKPQEGETGKMMSKTEVLGILTKAFPSLKMMAGLGIKLGLAMKKLGFEQTHPHNVAHYRVVQKVKPTIHREAA